MFCQKCGKEIPDGSVACNFCGEKITPPVKKETSYTQVFEWAVAIGILGAIYGLVSSLGFIAGFVIFLIGGFIVALVGASIYDMAR